MRSFYASTWQPLNNCQWLLLPPLPWRCLAACSPDNSGGARLSINSMQAIMQVTRACSQEPAVAADPWAAVTRSTKRNPICVINGMRLARCLPLSHALFSASPFCALQVLRQTNNSALKSFVHFMPCRTQHPIRQLRANLCPPLRSPRRVPLATGLCFLPHFNCNALNCGRRFCELYRQN